MEWSDEGIILHTRNFSESSLIVDILTPQHGRHAGLIRGKKANAALCQVGNKVHILWRGRLAEQLGTYTLELLSPHSSMVMDDAPRLLALLSMTSILHHSLPEREPNANLYNACTLFLDTLSYHPSWQTDYVILELTILSLLGYGLRLDACVASATTENLRYVSPKSGGAVCAELGKPYHHQLLPLPPFLVATSSHSTPNIAEVIDGLRLTGYFLERYVFAAQHQSLPAARGRLVNYLQQIVAREAFV